MVFTVLTVMLAMAVATPPDTTAAAEPGSAAPMNRREAKRLFKLPRGSLSLGMTNGGRLRSGVAMPLTGRPFAVFPSFVKRETNWGTSEMIGLLKRASAAVRKAFRRSVLGIGNISKEGGGQTGHSVSHKSGRDADIAMFAFNARGKRVNLMNFVKFQRDLWDTKKRYRFDVERNLALVMALVKDPGAPIQFIFCARWLKEAMLAEADAKKIDAETRRRLEKVLWMPSDSNPHHDHFHVRIYCSVEDRLQGCLERGPIHDWVDLGDGALAAHATELERVVAMKDPALQRRALEKLGNIRAKTAIGTVTRALGDVPRTRRVALQALERMGDLTALPGLLHALAQATDAPWAAKLLGAMARVGGRSIAEVAVAVLARPSGLLHETLAAKVPGELKLRAARILARFGRESALAPLLVALQTGPLRLKRAAHKALLHVTNQRIEPRARSTRQLARAQTQWQAFAKAHGDKRWRQWQRLGFVARGLKLSAPLTKADVPELIGVIASNDATASANAVWLLGELTGHEQDPSWRSARNNQRHWRSWWRDNAASLPAVLPPPPR